MESSKKENNGVSKSKESVHDYGKVILTVKNCLLPKEKLATTPSQLDGLDPETEADLRILGCELIQTAGILLKLPQVAMATAQVLFQRFYYSKSFVRQNYEVIGMACLYLASKIEETVRRIRDVVNVFHHIKQVNQQKILTPLVIDHNYISLKHQVIKAERWVLKELGFCVHVKHPHKLIVLYLQVLGVENKQNLMQISWNYMNDALRTDVFCRYQPETVACACIYLTARKLHIPLPRTPSWFSVFRVEEADIQDICARILSLYTRNKPDAEQLEKKVQELCKKYEESRLRSKTGFNNITSGTNTPNSPMPAEKKGSPKRRDSDRSRSRTTSDSPRHKKYKRSRSRSRSRSYDKYKKSRSRRSRSNSTTTTSKSYKDKRYRSRSRSYDRDREREYRDHKDGKYVSDRFKEDRYYPREDRYRRDDDRYRRDDDRYRKEDDYKYKKDDDKYKRDEDAVRVRKEDISKLKKEEEVVKSRKEEENNKRDEELVKHRKEEDRKKKEEHRKDKEKITVKEKESESKKVKSSKHASSKHKSSAEKEKKKRKKHYDEVIDDDDDIKIIHVKKEKKSR